MEAQAPLPSLQYPMPAGRGLLVGFNVGDLDGELLGASVGFAVVGLADGALEGLAEGGAVGEEEGDLVGGSVLPPPPLSSRMHEPLDHTQG